MHASIYFPHNTLSNSSRANHADCSLSHIQIRDLLNDTFPQNRIKSWFSFRELLHTFRELSVAPKAFGFRNCFNISLSKDVKISILGDFCWSVVLTADLD